MIDTETIKEAIRVGLIKCPDTKFPLKNSVVPKMVELAKQEATNREIGEKLNRHHASVSNSLRKYGRFIYLTFEEIEIIRAVRRAQAK